MKPIFLLILFLLNSIIYSQTRTTEEVYNHHEQAFLGQDINFLREGYDDNSIIITPDGKVNTDKKAIKETLSSLEKKDFPSFDQYFNEKKNFSGNVLVAVNGEAVYKKSFGYANIELSVKNTSETKFRIGSITKQFTAMAVLILQEQGKLNVSDKLSKYIKDIPDVWKEITIHQLLTHTSGIMHSWDLDGFADNMMLYIPLEEVIEKYKDQPLVAAPGEKYEYSGTGYFILATVIEKVTGKSYEAFLKEEIFTEIGMSDTGVDNPRSIIPNRASGYITDSTGTYNSTFIYMPILTGGGNLYSTTDDLLKWDQSFYNNTLLSEESKEKMFTPELNNYAYGWRVLQSDTLYRISHGGSTPGFGAMIDRHPKKKLLTVILFNRWTKESYEIVDDFLKLVLEETENR